MNFKLKREIIFHLFNKLGIFVAPNKPMSLVENLLKKEYLLDRKLKFETETGNYENQIFAASTKIEMGTVKIMVANLSEDVLEYVSLIQLDNYPPFVIRLSLDPEDSGALMFRLEKKWIEAAMLYQAKLLVALESLIEVVSPWTPLTEYQDIYNTLIDFLKFENSEE